MKKIYACAFLVLTLFVLNSCKKDILIPERTEIGNGIKKDYIKLEKVNYELFIKELGTKSPSGLNEFNKGKKFKGQLSFSTSSQTSIILETDSISKIQNQDHTTFTIPVKLASKYAVNFQNLIIDIDKGKTTSFLITYFPDKAYKQKIHDGENPFFTGRIIRSPFNLTNGGIGTLANPSGPATVSGVVCTTTTFISGVQEVLCDGPLHHSVNDPDAANCGANNPAHYEFTYSTSLDCVYEGGNGSGGNGDGGGGGGPTALPPPPQLLPVGLLGNTLIIFPTPPSSFEPCMEDGGSGNDPNSITPGGTTATVCGSNTPIEHSYSTVILKNLLELTDDQADLINQNASLSTEISNYLDTQGQDQTTKLYVKSTLQYLLNSQTRNLDEFKRSFLSIPDAIDGIYNSNFANNLQQQFLTLPSKSAFYREFPKIESSDGRIYQMLAPAVYTLAGGQLNTKNKAGNQFYQNACAIRGSLALNGLGLTIPEIDGTEKGKDNKNFIVNAKNFNEYMNKTFGPATITLEGADLNPDNVVDKLAGRTGIYSMVNGPSAPYSGHVDMIIGGSCITKLYLNSKTVKIEVWILQ